MRNLTKREGLMLYWCEGSKDRYAIYVNNTDPQILKWFIYWLEKYYNVKRSEFKIFLHLWTSKIKDEDKIKREWAKILDLKIEQFRKSYFKPTIATKNGDKYPLGTCRIRINNKLIADKIKKEIEHNFG